VDIEILDLLDNCNYRSISEIPSVQTCDFCTLYLPFSVGMHKDVSKYHWCQKKIHPHVHINALIMTCDLYKSTTPLQDLMHIHINNKQQQLHTHLSYIYIRYLQR
jgi:hypothetical protein